MSLMIPLNLLMYLFQQGLRGFQDIGYIVVGNSFLQLALKAVLVVVLLWMGFGLNGYILATVISTLFACLWLGFGLWRKISVLPRSTETSNPGYDAQWIDYAKIQYGNSLLGAGASYFDRFLLGWLGGTASVGILQIVKQIQQMPVVFLQMFRSILAPMFAAAHARQDHNEQAHLFHLTTDWVVRLASPLCLFMLMFAEPLLNLFGKGFAETGAYPLRIMVLAQLFNLATGPLASLLNMSGKEAFLFKLSLAEQVIIVIGLMLIVPAFGLNGAATVFAANIIILNLLTYSVARKHCNLQWFDTRYLRWPLPILTTLATGSTVLTHGSESPSLGALILTLILIYVVFNTVFFMQGLHDDDRLLLTHFRERLTFKKSILTSLKELLNQYLLSRIADMRGRSVYSNYADKNHCIFIHIPKAAGTSVALTLFNKESRHVPWLEYYHANPQKFHNYYKFTFVRNPWDRLVSTYFFLKRGGMDPQDAIWANENLKEYPTFESFVHGWLNEESIHSWVHFKPQHYFICDDEGRLQMDFVGKVENITHDFAVVAKKLHCTRPLARVNTGNLQHYSTYYTDEMRMKVARIYARDIELFGYEFEKQ